MYPAPLPKHGLAQARMADDRDFAGIDGGIRLQIVDDSARAPRPGSQRALIVRRRFGLAWLEEQRPNSISDAARKIRFDVAIISGGKRVFV